MSVIFQVCTCVSVCVCARACAIRCPTGFKMSSRVLQIAQSPIAATGLGQLQMKLQL